MAIPTLTKTWQFCVNQLFAAQGTFSADQKTLMWSGLKNSLIGANAFTNAAGATITPTGVWQVRGSSNGTLAALLAVGATGPGTDYWTSNSAFTTSNGSGSPYSWMVLRQTGIASNFEIMISCPNINTSLDGNIYISPSAGFTGGSISALPTATDQIQLLSTNSLFVPTSDVNVRLHVLVSTDGSATYIIGYAANAVVLFLSFVKPNAAVSGWTNPSLSHFLNNTGATFSNLYNTANGHGLMGSTPFTAFVTGEAANGTILGSLLTVPNAADGNYIIAPMGIASSTSGAVGRHGVMPDLYWAQSGANNGDVYPSDGTRQFATHGNIITPWNGTVPATS